MSRRSTFAKLHEPQNIEKWEWKASGNSRIIAVPTTGESADLLDASVTRSFGLFASFAFLISVLQLVFSMEM